jgi:hypothetical protein
MQKLKSSNEKIIKSGNTVGAIAQKYKGYNSFSCKIYHNGHLSEPFLTTSGVSQGCLLSPLLFLLVLDRILKTAMTK